MIHSSPCGDPGPRTRAGVAALLAALLTAIAACHAPAQRAAPPAAAPPAVTYDWHSLLSAPFGSVLKEAPLKLHEVLLFRDEASGAAPAEGAAADAECYAADAPAPTFLGRAPDEYLLCFKQDRLSRIQASVRLPPDQAPGVFAAACAQWLKDAAPPPASAACEGRDDAIHFSLRLEEEAGHAESPPTDREVSISLESAANPSVERP
jgi:hypothetical protein